MTLKFSLNARKEIETGNAYTLKSLLQSIKSRWKTDNWEIILACLQIILESFILLAKNVVESWFSTTLPLYALKPSGYHFHPLAHSKNIQKVQEECFAPCQRILYEHEVFLGADLTSKCGVDMRQCDEFMLFVNFVYWH